MRRIGRDGGRSLFGSKARHHRASPTALSRGHHTLLAAMGWEGDRRVSDVLCPNADLHGWELPQLNTQNYALVDLLTGHHWNCASLVSRVARGGFVVLLLLAPVSPIPASEPGDQLDSSDVVLLLAANALCKPVIVAPSIVDAAVQRLDDARHSDWRAFLTGQAQMMVELSIEQPPMYVDNICDGARIVAAKHNILDVVL